MLWITFKKMLDKRGQKCKIQFVCEIEYNHRERDE